MKRTRFSLLAPADRRCAVLDAVNTHARDWTFAIDIARALGSTRTVINTHLRALALEGAIDALPIITQTYIGHVPRRFRAKP